MTKRPALALGTVQFGLPYGIAGATAPVAEADVRAILRHAHEAGVSRLDTAAAYGDIEQRLAVLVGDLPFTVVSKIAPPPPASGDDVQEFVCRSIAQSHARLGHLLVGILFHDPGILAGPNGATLWSVAKEECDRRGIALGVSGYDPAEIAELNRRDRVAMAQLPGNALDQRVAAAGDIAGELTLRSLFLQGLLLMNAEDAERRVANGAEPVRLWREWCSEQGVTPLEGALAVGKSFNADYAVVGVDTPAQWEEIAAAWLRVAPAPGPLLAASDPRVIDPRRWSA